MDKTIPGSWISTIRATEVYDKKDTRQYFYIDGKKNIYYQDKLADGRSTIIKNQKELLPQEYSAKTRVHEYGGCSYFVFEDKVFFSNSKDQNIYLLSSGKVEKITDSKNKRYADGVYHNTKEVIYLICEEHLEDGTVANSIVMVNLKTKEETVVEQGADFYSNPRISPDGKNLCFISWSDPNMPWDSSFLYVADILDDGKIENVKKLSGNKGESVIEPQYSKEGKLYFLNDQTGYWNLYCFFNGTVEKVLEKEAEFGYPPWVFGIKTYALLDDGSIFATYVDKKEHKLCHIIHGKIEEIKCSYSTFDEIVSDGKDLYCIAGSWDKPSEFISVDSKTKQIKVLDKNSLEIDKSDISKPENIVFSNQNGDEVFGYFYPPKNKDYTLKQLPPLIIRCHGGPTAKAYPKYSLETQYWTNRGYAIFDINYSGSCGYGREYRERLNGNWGQLDVDDCKISIECLSNKIDRNKVIIRGKSAGAYTALMGLCNSSSFAIGCSYYGIGDQEKMVEHTHKFEAHYTDSLIGPYPEEKKLYYDRSPIHFVDNIQSPVLFFHGLKDQVVLPEQTETMYQALKKNKIPVSYVPFENEGHGFRNQETLVRALEAEELFYSKIFGFNVDKSIPEIEINNL